VCYRSVGSTPLFTIPRLSPFYFEKSRYTPFSVKFRCEIRVTRPEHDFGSRKSSVRVHTTSRPLPKYSFSDSLSLVLTGSRLTSYQDFSAPRRPLDFAFLAACTPPLANFPRRRFPLRLSPEYPSLAGTATASPRVPILRRDRPPLRPDGAEPALPKLERVPSPRSPRYRVPFVFLSRAKAWRCAICRRRSAGDKSSS
jgi:hypothetical protein